MGVKFDNGLDFLGGRNKVDHNRVSRGYGLLILSGYNLLYLMWRVHFFGGTVRSALFMKQ